MTPPLGHANNSPYPYGEGGGVLVESRDTLDINRKHTQEEE